MEFAHESQLYYYECMKHYINALPQVYSNGCLNEKSKHTTTHPCMVNYRGSTLST